MTGIRHVEVVIPARDEAALIPSALAAVRRAVAGVGSGGARGGGGVGPSTGVIVVADRCRDATAALAAALGATVLACQAGMVGAARDAGARVALRACAARGIAADAVWLACTDADTLVPADWLTRQIELAGAGADAVLGTVAPLEPIPRIHRSWSRRHRLGEGHRHVHGANLGVRGSTYQAVGGFESLPCGEDARLAQRIREGGWRWVATDTTRVLTSARRNSRVAGGFADYLTRLDGPAPARPSAAAPPGGVALLRPRGPHAPAVGLSPDELLQASPYSRQTESPARLP